MNKEEHFLKNRFLELANIAYERNIYTFTDFLNINEINILNTYSNLLPPVSLQLSGGNSYAERKVAIFSAHDICYEQQPPITVIKIAPINSQFADNLCHRDFLGAILNLGINRNKIGDIFIKDNTAYVYCIDEIAEYITENLNKIRHTFVKSTLYNMAELNITPELKQIKGTVANIRLDSLIATAFGTSRSSIISYIEGGKVFVNGKLITSNGYSIKENDIVSVRGKGRFIYDGTMGVTKKGRNMISIHLYI
ncbi:MAG: RNA-binding protein [Eubacterium sp.]